MNAKLADTLAHQMLNVSTHQEAINVSAHQATN